MCLCSSIAGAFKLYPCFFDKFYRAVQCWFIRNIFSLCVPLWYASPTPPPSFSSPVFVSFFGNLFLFLYGRAYRYGRSLGRPSEKGLQIDAQVRLFFQAGFFRFPWSLMDADLFCFRDATRPFITLQTALEYIDEHPVLRHTPIVRSHTFSTSIAFSYEHLRKNRFYTVNP